MKKILLISLLLMLVCSLSVFAEETDGLTVKGTIEEIAADNSYIVVDGQKILTDEYFLEGSYLGIGDEVAIKVEDYGQGLEALTYSYIFEEEHDSSKENAQGAGQEDSLEKY